MGLKDSYTNYFVANLVNVIFRRQSAAAKVEAEKEGIVVPTTLEDYCIKPKIKPSNPEPAVGEI